MKSTVLTLGHETVRRLALEDRETVIATRCLSWHLDEAALIASRNPSCLLKLYVSGSP